MRKAFYSAFLKEDAWLLYGDVGYGIVSTDHARCVNVGIAEQTMVAMAAGMAECGARVYTYCIGPMIYRAWEQVRNLVAGTQRDVTLVVVGVGDDYAAIGKTHCVSRRELSISCYTLGLPYYCPDSLEDLEDAMSSYGPKLIHLRKGGV